MSFESDEYTNATIIKTFNIIVTLYLEFKNVCLDTLDSIVPKNALFPSTEKIVREFVIAAMRHVICLQVVEISQHSQLSQWVRDFE